MDATDDTEVKTKHCNYSCWYLEMVTDYVKLSTLTIQNVSNTDETQRNMYFI